MTTYTDEQSMALLDVAYATQQYRDMRRRYDEHCDKHAVSTPETYVLYNLVNEYRRSRDEKITAAYDAGVRLEDLTGAMA
jgi:hypothetical protein